MKITPFLIIFFYFGIQLKAQQFDDITFYNLPQNYQLYPRNAQNQGTVLIKGKVETSTWNYISVQVFRNNSFFKYLKLPLINSRFATAISITAEKAEYKFKIYKVNTRDSSLVVSRENVVSGDVYVLTGQSNATCLFNETRKNEYCRTFGTLTGTFNTETYNPSDTLWTLSNQQPYVTDVGIFGFEIQQNITDTYNIPTCLINSGFNWSSAAQHANRNPNNPTDLTTGYGRMLYRLQKGGIVNNVKALIYRQGETEAYGEGYDFIGNFTRFYNFIKFDLLNIAKLYVFQIDIINFARPNIAPVVRDDQRKLEQQYNDIRVIPSIGTTGFDGLHYSSEGYAQNAFETSRIIGSDFYNAPNNDNITSPNITKAYYSKLDKSEITLEFQAGQELTWQNEYQGQPLTNFFYLDGISGNVQAGNTFGRRAILALNNPSNATKISYLPSFVPETASYFPYSGPYITNRKNMRAFSFYNVNIENPPVCLLNNSCCSINESLQSGNWNDASIWSCNHIPTKFDNTFIHAGHTILTSTNIEVKSLQNEGILKLSNGINLQVKF
jgi:hypothetical protein